MSIYDTLEKRHHVVKYKPEPVPHKLFNELLYQAWKISPSKNNFMPYKVSVIGPFEQEQKNIIYNKVANNHLFYDKIGLTFDTKNNPKLKKDYEFIINPNYYHVKYNSHLLIFSSRVCPRPNRFYQRMVKEYGHFAEQCEVSQVRDTAESVSFEVGLFASNLTALCIENNIDVSYTGCLPKSEDKWKDTPYLWYDKEKQLAKVHSIMSVGYGDYFRYQWLKDKDVKKGEDVKPELDEIVEWI
tara:strand:- start:74 stop:799 length:726 start_codon:yes stop_codon:yes gene_type:complete